MKLLRIFSLTLILSGGGLMLGCSRIDTVEDSDSWFKEEIMVKCPVPEKKIERVELTKEEQGLVVEENNFALHLLSLLNVSNKDAGFVFSPLSLSLDLAMAANGTTGDAGKEVLGVLGFNNDDFSQYNAYCKKVMEGLPAVDLGTRVKIANAVIVDAAYPVKDAFKSMIAHDYYGVVESLPFQKWDFVRKRVNGWVSDCTEGLIPEILGDREEGNAAYLLNALYLKAKLSQPFNKEQSYHATFHAPTEDKSIVFMTDFFQVPFESNNYYSSICLPLGNQKFGLRLYLPNEGVSLDDLLTQLQKEKVGVRHSEPYFNTNVVIPRINTSSEFTNMVPALKNLGISGIFNPCFFEEMLEIDVPMVISDVLHVAKFSLDESGIECAAATSIGVAGIAPPNLNTEYREFVADRPFVYLVQEQTSGTVLFAGIYKGE